MIQAFHRALQSSASLGTCIWDPIYQGNLRRVANLADIRSPCDILPSNVAKSTFASRLAGLTYSIPQSKAYLLIEARAAALQPDQQRWYDIIARLRALFPAPPMPHPGRLESIWLFVSSLVGGYPPAVARGDLDPGWFLIEMHFIPQTLLYIILIDGLAFAFQFVRPFVTLVSDGYAFVGAVLLVYSLLNKERPCGPKKRLQARLLLRIVDHTFTNKCIQHTKVSDTIFVYLLPVRIHAIGQSAKRAYSSRSSFSCQRTL